MAAASTTRPYRIANRPSSATPSHCATRTCSTKLMAACTPCAVIAPSAWAAITPPAASLDGARQEVVQAHGHGSVRRGTRDVALEADRAGALQARSGVGRRELPDRRLGD